MCGIGGIISSDNSLQKSFLNWINDRQSHRGPDNKGLFYSEKVGICHQRLSIIDLSNHSNQPYKYSKTIISFNGEIYNFKLLLYEKKYSKLLNIKSDTSFFASAWSYFGVSILKDLVGMYSVSIFDQESNEITLTTDEFGTKSIFYFQGKDFLLWASEFEALFSFVKNKGMDFNINEQSLAHTYSFLSPFCGETIVKEIKRVLPGESLIFDDKAKLVSKIKYNLLEEKKMSKEKINLRKIADEVGKTFISDVPIANMISGGIDSSYICCQLKDRNIFQKLYHYKHPTSKEGFVSDTEYAEHLTNTLDIKLNNLEARKNITKNELKNIFKAVKVSGDITAAIPLFDICKEIKKTSSCKVLLSGLGADEIFHGYRIHKMIAIKQLLFSRLNILFRILNFLFVPKFQFILTKPFARRIKLSLEILSKRNNSTDINSFKWGSSTKSIDMEFINHYKKIGMINSSSFSKTVSLYFMHFLAANHLPVSDSVSMEHSLELRPVFLTKNLLNKQTFIPTLDTIFFQKKELKNYLKNRFGKQFINRPKVGFGIEPILFSEELIQWLFKVIKVSKFCKKSLLQRIRNDLDNKNDPLYPRRLYGLISLAHSVSLIEPSILKIN